MCVLVVLSLTVSKWEDENRLHDRGTTTGGYLVLACTFDVTLTQRIFCTTLQMVTKDEDVIHLCSTRSEAKSMILPVGRHMEMKSKEEVHIAGYCQVQLVP